VNAPGQDVETGPRGSLNLYFVRTAPITHANPLGGFEARDRFAVDPGFDQVYGGAAAQDAMEFTSKVAHSAVDRQFAANGEGGFIGG
jgi:hypothetical protein